MIEGIGERGKDFVEIWHSPEAPNESVKDPSRQEAYLRYAGGMFVARSATESEWMEQAGGNGHYIKADPEMTKPLSCEDCGTPWFSREAFTRHYKFAHGGTIARSRR